MAIPKNVPAFKNERVKELVELSDAMEIERYMEALERLKKKEPKAYAEYAKIGEFDEVGDIVWFIFNSPPGGTEEEITELLVRLAAIA